MKTVTVSEIIRTSQFGDTRYVLASEAQERETFLEDVRTSLNDKNLKLQERERVLVEALECTLSALRIASRQLTEDMKMVLNGKRWGESDIKRAEKVLGIKE